MEEGGFMPYRLVLFSTRLLILMPEFQFNIIQIDTNCWGVHIDFKNGFIPSKKKDIAYSTDDISLRHRHQSVDYDVFNSSVDYDASLAKTRNRHKWKYPQLTTGKNLILQTMWKRVLNLQIKCVLACPRVPRGLSCTTDSTVSEKLKLSTHVVWAAG